MAEYYRNPYKTGSGTDERRSLWLIVVDAIMYLLSATAVLSMFIILVGRFVSPEKMWYFSLLGLVAPMVYITVVLSLFYWIIRWKWRPATVTGAFVLLGLFHVPLYYKLDFTKQYGEQKYDRNNIKVLTFNVHNFYDENGKSTVDSVFRFVQSLNPDIVCFQEYALDVPSRKQQDEKFRAYNFGSSKLPATSATMECMTKHRIIGAARMEDLGGTGVCITTDMVINDDTVRVFNLHLQTTSINSQDKDYISQGEFISDSTRETRFIQIARSLRRNNALRAHQVDMIHEEVANSPYPVILCGDFNDIPASYTYRKVAKGLDDSFSRQGHLFAHTFRGFFNMLRIDYILLSPELETVSYEVVPTGNISDHYPVTVRLKQTQKL